MFSLKYSQSNDSLTSTSTLLSSKRQTMLRKYIVAGPVYVCLPNKIIEFTWLSKDFSFQPCISYVNVTKQWGATVPMQRGFLSVLEKNSSSGKNKKPIGHRLREWTELTDINTGYLESRGIPVVVPFLDRQKKTKITLFVTLAENLQFILAFPNIWLCGRDRETQDLKRNLYLHHNNIPNV